MSKTLLFYKLYFKFVIMSKKNIFLVAAWYVLWGIVASIYNKKNPKELEEKLKKSKWEWDFKILFDDFIETHINLFESLKEQDFVKKGQNIIWEKKEQLFEIVDVYKNQGIELLDELKLKWKDYIIETSDKLEKLYQEKKVEIEWLKEVTPEKMIFIRDKLIASFNEIKDKIKEENKDDKGGKK